METKSTTQTRANTLKNRAIATAITLSPVIAMANETPAPPSIDVSTLVTFIGVTVLAAVTSVALGVLTVRATIKGFSMVGSAFR